MSIWPRLVWDASRNVGELVGQRVRVPHKPQMKAKGVVMIESVWFVECEAVIEINRMATYEDHTMHRTIYFCSKIKPG